jgi:alpha-D-xyloside xylohydrolase
MISPSHTLPPTRLIESFSGPYNGVERTEVVRLEPGRLVLKTFAPTRWRRGISSADPEMAARHEADANRPAAEGELWVEFVSERTVRVRYLPDGTVQSGTSRMLVREPVSCNDVRFVAEGAHVIAATAHMRLRIELEPFRILVEDAEGRQLTVIGGPEKNNFQKWDALGTGHAKDGDAGKSIAMECFSLGPQECVYGLGEKFIRLDKTGQTIDLDMQDALGVTSPRSYKNIPFYVSTAGYGVFFNHSSRMTFWVGSRSACDIQAAIEDDHLDFFLIAGSIREILSAYTDLTGKPAEAPEWTHGYWQSKISYQSAEEVLEIAREMRRHEVPCDVIHLDTHWFRSDWFCDLEFDPVRFPDPAKFFRELRKMGMRVSLWQLPYVPEGSSYFDELAAVDGFVKTPDGGIHDCGMCFTPGFQGIVGVIDFTNPAAVLVFQARLRRLFELGASVIKTDFGEDAPVDGIYHDGTPGTHAHNLYPLLYNRAAYEVTRDATGEGVVWGRSAWAGSQRYPLLWGGDNSPNFENMIPQLAGGLSLGLCGFPYWSQDIGGFCGTTDDLLLIRWMQLGMFLSHSRIHGYGDRELYKFSPDVIRICRDFIRLRYSLLPYILGSGRKCVAESLPMARPLVVDFQDDPNTHTLHDQFLFGESILVAPVTTKDGKRRLYLPQGDWTCWWTGTVHPGGCWLDTESSHETIPLLLREGAVVPMCEPMNHVGEKPLQSVTVRLTPFRRAGSERELPMIVNGDRAHLRLAFDGTTHFLQYDGPSLQIHPEWTGPEQPLKLEV